jgi:hypothetical protein
VTPKGEPSKQAVKYLYRLIAERLLYETMDDEIGYVKWVALGKEREPQAVAAFQFANDVMLEPGGFLTTDDGRLGASPDRLFKGHRESIEIKCPAAWTQIGYLLDGPGDDYRPQVMGHLLVGEGQLDSVHFYSWHPQTPPVHTCFLPDRAYLGVLRSALSSFCDALDVMTERARSLGAYAVVRRVETPAEVAYQRDEDMQLKIVNPEAPDE